MPRQGNQSSTKKKKRIHKKQAQLERDYYKQNTKLAKEQKEIAHYSFDWAQDVLVPHYSQQPKEEFFKSQFKVHLFGFQNEATGIQTNYTLGEHELLNKGPNGTLSLVFNSIKQLNRGEKHLKLTCDNCTGQNKNNFALWLYLYLVICGYYQTIELNFMIAGHTKFRVDSILGLIKRLYRKSTIFGTDEFAEVVIKSSSFNKVQRYEDSQGFQYFDFKVLERYFKTLPNIGKYHHFLFEASNPEVVKVQEFANGDFIEVSLWKDPSKIAENIEEIRNLIFPILIPEPLSLERQEYLYKNFPTLIGERRGV